VRSSMKLTTALCLTTIFACVPLCSQTEPVPAASPPLIDLAFSASWCRPNLDPVFNSYASIERSLGLDSWKNDGLRYLVAAEARHRVMDDQYVFVEGTASAMYRRKGQDASYTGLYRAGAGYRMRLLSEPFEGSVHASVGATWVNFSRTYNDNRLEINDSKTGTYFTLGASAGYPLHGNILVEASLRYVFVPKLQLSALQTEVQPGGPAAGLGLSIAI